MHTSAFAFKENPMDIREIGKILNVENGLEAMTKAGEPLNAGKIVESPKNCFWQAK